MKGQLLKKGSTWVLKSFSGRQGEYPLKPEDYNWAEDLALYNGLETVSRGVQVVAQTTGEPVEVEFKVVRGGEFRGHADITIENPMEEEDSTEEKPSYQFTKPRDLRHLESFQKFGK